VSQLTAVGRAEPVADASAFKGDIEKICKEIGALGCESEVNLKARAE
jgi:hypothetical protein